MKKQILLITLLLSFGALAQNGGMNYKALITNNNNALSNHNVTIKFTILQNGTTSVYQETQTATTDANGIVAVNIGEGNAVSGNFNTIDWGADDYFLKVEINTGSGYTNFGTSELKYVPYAKYADNAGNVFSGDYNDLSNRPVFSSVAVSGNYNDLSNKPVVFIKKGTNNQPATAQTDSIVHAGKMFLGVNDNIMIYSNVIHSQLTLGNNTVAENVAGKVYQHNDANHDKSFGDMNILSGDGTADKVGAYQYIVGTSSNGSYYGNIVYIQESGQGDRYGVYNTIIGNGDGIKYGVRNDISGQGNEYYFGVYNYLKQGKSVITGVFNKIESSENQKHYGTVNLLNVNSSRKQYGSFTDVYNDGAGDSYGSYNTVSGNGTGDKYGVYAVVDKTVPGTHYAVYGESLKSGSYAGYFKGQMYVSNKIGVGIDAPSGKIQSIPGGNLNDGGSINYDNAGLIIGSTSNGLSFDANQIERTGGTFYINFLSGNDINLCNGGGNVIINNKLTAPASGNADMKAYVYGYINSSGSIQTNASSNGFTVIRQSIGKYKVTFSDNSINTNYSVIATVNGSQAYVISAHKFTDFFYINIFDLNGYRHDAEFFFTVYRKN
jgi:hypothetical protein